MRHNEAMKLTAAQQATLTLARTKGVGPKLYDDLLQRCGCAEEALRALPTLKRPLAPPTHATIEQELAALEQLGATLLCRGDASYPALLAPLPDAPLVLSVWGDVQALNSAQVAFVGTRNASAAAVQFTQTLVQDVVAGGYSITSGLARGVDSAAHHAALQQGAPTIAVVAGGLGAIYPPQNIPLAEQIAASGGCVVSEQPFDMVATRQHFPRRNRIIAGLSLATVVTEAGRHSGSLITAQYAGDYGRNVFAVPGAPADPRAAGGNHLIAQGATLLTDSTPLLAAVTQARTVEQPRVHYTREQSFQATLDLDSTTSIEPADSRPPLEDDDTPTNATDHIAQLLGSSGVSVDALVQQSGRSEVEVVSALTELELLGQAVRQADGLVRAG